MTSNVRNSSVVQQLRTRLQQMERAGTRTDGPSALSSTGIAALDAMLSAGVFRAGMIVEWIVAGEGSGAARLALPMARQSLQNGGVLVVIDERREFYPPAAVRLGLDLSRTIVVRPRNHQEAIWTLEQALRCPGVAATLSWIEQLPDRLFRRLQLAAEHGAGLGILLRPAAARHTTTWADLRWWVEPVRSGQGASTSGRQLRIELLHCREGTPAGAIDLEIDDETGAVRVVPPLAAAASVSRAAGA
jgi:protein ImuA